MKTCVLLGTLILGFAISAAENETPEKQAQPASAEAAKPDAAAKFAGKWVGTWESVANIGHGGKLTCVTIAKTNEEWEAVVVAEYSEIDDGPSDKFTVNLKGISKGDDVVFNGKLDLDEQGGLFTWTGSATGNEFKGEYKGPGENGAFKMVRVVEKAPAEVKR